MSVHEDDVTVPLVLGAPSGARMAVVSVSLRGVLWPLVVARASGGACMPAVVSVPRDMCGHFVGGLVGPSLIGGAVPARRVVLMALWICICNRWHGARWLFVMVVGWMMMWIDQHMPKSELDLLQKLLLPSSCACVKCPPRAWASWAWVSTRMLMHRLDAVMTNAQIMPDVYLPCLHSF